MGRSRERESTTPHPDTRATIFSTSAYLVADGGHENGEVTGFVARVNNGAVREVEGAGFGGWGIGGPRGTGAVGRVGDCAGARRGGGGESGLPGGRGAVKSLKLR